MKNCFLVPVVFIVNFCFWLLTAALFSGIWQYLVSNPKEYIFLLYSILHYMYLLLPAACTIAVFSVYVFLMRHKSKPILSFFLLLVIFSVFFAVVMPLIYSQGKKIDSRFYAQEKTQPEDIYLHSFISPPEVISRTNKFISPLIDDMYARYTAGYTQYLIFAGSFFFFILSLWVCTVLTEWKIINFALLPFFTIAGAYGYGFAVLPAFKTQFKAIVPFAVPDPWIIPSCFLAVGMLFLLYTAILLHIRKPKIKRAGRKPSQKRKKVKPARIKTASPVKNGSRRKPRQSRLSGKNQYEDSFE